MNGASDQENGSGLWRPFNTQDSVVYALVPERSVATDRFLWAYVRCSFVPFPTAHVPVVWWRERSNPLVAMNTTTSIRGTDTGLWIFNDQGS